MIKGSDKMNSKNIEQINELLKVLKENGVEYFKDSNLEIKISPVKLLHAVEEKLDKKKEEVSEDDLYYSASKFKPRNK